jgi:hypothetical protein
MKQRQPNLKPQSAEDVELLLTDPEIRTLVQRLARLHAQGASEQCEPRVRGYDEDVAAAIHRLAYRCANEPFDERAFLNAMAATRPVAAMPRVGESILDYWRIFAQPEIAEELWPMWQSRPGRRGRDPGIFGKALLFATAVFGVSPQFKSNHRLLVESTSRRRLFEWLEATGAAAAGLPARPWGAKNYERGVEQVHKVAALMFPDVGLEGMLYVPEEILALNVRIHQELHRLLDLEEVDVAIDGCLFPAWTAQYQEEHSEARNARPRSLGSRRYANGYYFFPLVVLQTGLPLAWILVSANVDEQPALRDLLALVFRLWPDLKIRSLVADAAWDEAEIVGYTMTRYGIPLIARRPRERQEWVTLLHPLRAELVSEIRGDGAVRCRKHGCTMIRNGYECGRGNLPPGIRASETRFRVRQVCPIGGDECGRVGVLMREEWAALSPLPHSLAVGQPRAHAKRLALLSRRNSVESLFSALQGTNKLLLKGAARTRTPKEPTVAALVSVAAILRSATMLADQRIRLGDFPESPPADVAARLGTL